jgi:hypothetical protein
MGPTHPSIKWVSRGSFPGVKRPGYDVHHLLLSSTEVENKWSYTSIPHICLYGVDRDYTWHHLLTLYSPETDYFYVPYVS